MHQFYYTNCPAVVSLLQPPEQVTRDYVAALQHERAVHAPRTPLARQSNWADMVVDETRQGTAPRETATLPGSSDANSAAAMQVREYAVSTQGRGAELMTTHSEQSRAEQDVQRRVNQICAALWQEQQSLAIRSQFYEAVEWTARAEREQSGVASVDAQALEEWLANNHAQHEQAKRSRQETEREQRNRPEKYRAKNLITKKRPAELQRDLVQLLFGQIIGSQERNTHEHEDEHRARENERSRDTDRDTYRDTNRDRDTYKDRERHRERDRHYQERDYDREHERRDDRCRDRDRDRERRDERGRDDEQDRKRRREDSEERENNKRHRYR
jgi:hypothetical protein